MLSGFDTETIAFSGDGSAVTLFCRRCAARKIPGGLLLIQLHERGLRPLPREWETISRYEVNESAWDWGYEMGAERGVCGLDQCAAAPTEESMGEWHCPACAHLYCEECGQQLDDYEREAVAT